MERPLIKLYIILSAALALSILFVPAIVNRTSAWMADKVTQAKLLVYQGNAEGLAGAIEQEKGKVVIIMDDGWETQYTSGYKTLAQYGFCGCVAVIPAAVGTQGYMDYGQLAELYTHGWDLLNHTYNHANLMEMSSDEQKDQVNRAREWLNDHLFIRGSNIVVYPQGEFSKSMTGMLGDEGYIAARSMKSLWIAQAGGSPENVEICNIISSMTFQSVREAIDKAMENKSTVILVVHKIEPVSDKTQMQIEEKLFRNVVAYLAANSEHLSVITMTELLAMQQY